MLAGPALAGIAGHYWLSRAKLAVKSQGVAILTEPDFWMFFFQWLACPSIFQSNLPRFPRNFNSEQFNGTFSVHSFN